MSYAGQTLSDGAESKYPTKAPYSVQQVVNYFLDKADEASRPMTQLKLLKLVYIAYGWFLALTGEKLFRDEIEAWKHGPVVPSVYHEFKHFRNGPISDRATELDLDTWEENTPRIEVSEDDALVVLDKVWSSYGMFDGWSLRQKTHQPDSPWARVYVDGEKNVILKDDDIRNHYIDRIKRYIDAANE